MAFGRFENQDFDYDDSYSGGDPGAGGAIPVGPAVGVGTAGVDTFPGGSGTPWPTIPGTNIPEGDYSGVGGLNVGSGGGGGGGFGGGGGGGGGFQFSGINFDFGPVPVFSPDPFIAPTLEDAKNEPGYKFQLGEGVTALDRGAASRGGLRTGGHNKDILQYGQNLASQTYSNVFDRALKAYGARYQAQRDMFAPRLAEWQNRAAAERAKQLAMFNAQFMNRGGGGGGYDPLQAELDILGPEPVPDVWSAPGVPGRQSF